MATSVVRTQFLNLNFSPLKRSFAKPQRLQLAIWVDLDVCYSLSRPKRLLVRSVTFRLQVALRAGLARRL
jgi:hypothetical protein